MTKIEYSDFISTFGFFDNYLKKLLNNVYFNEGIKLPYDMTELYTSIRFQEQSLHILLELESNGDFLFEKNLWDGMAVEEKEAKIAADIKAW